ncbi:sugar transferase [Devosia sp. CN2-171]|jgi:exopolysaccharide production protein ExoY|uniref:sugar transferase n=1 Tax=Devosia sp. CN2-171 TaxID=3400909 RepID=UPI003BF885A8
MSVGEDLGRAHTLAEQANVPVGGRLKRFVDLVAAALLLTFFSPLFVVLVVAVRLSGRGPVIFAHKRLGAGGKPFDCYKFRTMVPNAQDVLDRLLVEDSAARSEWTTTQKLANDPRITKVGRILRMTSMDELPQLLNVLIGEMSLVGPRPIVEDERRHYGTQYRAYTAARPGITGLWQVSGRSDTTYQTRVALDAEYVSGWSFGLDLKILLRTIVVVLFMRGSR